MGYQISDKAARVADVFEQIAAVNEMIKIHFDDKFMLSQYMHRKQQFIEELNETLLELDLSISQQPLGPPY